MHPLARSALAGAGAGSAATVPMSLVMLLAREVRALGTPPPHMITRRLLGRWPARRRRDALLSTLNHFAFGAAAGALFSPIGRWTGRRPARIVAGALYGVAVWAGMYGAVLPALGIMRRPARDRPGRPIAMVAAHVVYGLTLGAATPR